MHVSISFRGEIREMDLDEDMSYSDFLEGIHQESTIPVQFIKLIAPKVGMIKSATLPNGDQTPIKHVFPSSASRTRIVLLGPSADKINQLQEAETARAKEMAKMNQRIRTMRQLARRPVRSSLSSSPSSSTSSSWKYTFDRVEPLPGLPNPERSREFLEKIKNDRGVRALMSKYKWSVPLLTELGPNESNNLLGRNTGQGKLIELRLRTDDYQGWRSYRDVVRVLCHELAHNEISDHNHQFWELTHKLEREVIELDPFGRKGHQLLADMYNPEESPVCDDGGWFGSTQRLGGLDGPSGATGGSSGTDSGPTISASGPSRADSGQPTEDETLQAKIRRAAEERNRRDNQ